MNATTVTQDREELRQLIINTAYFQEMIVLSSGKESDYYIDARLVTLTPRGAYLCARLMLDIIGDEQLDAIGGPTLGADPMVGAIGVVSMQENRPRNNFIIRKEAKAHGKGKQIEGPFLAPGSKVVIIDDVATTGKAFLHSIDVLESLNIQVQKAICIVDREEGASEAVAAKGCELVSLFKASDIHQV